MNDILLHASCVAVGLYGVLITGSSGAGKSDLALRLIDRGAKLVADDYTDLRPASGSLMASPPERLRGLLEVRGVGIFRYNYIEKININLVVALQSSDEIERLPHKETITLHKVPFPLIRINAFEASAPVKVEWAVRALQDGSLDVGFFQE